MSEILLALEKFMRNRLALDYNAKASFSNFVKFISDKDGICEVHDAVAPDIDLCVLADQYEDVKQSSTDKRNQKAIENAETEILQKLTSSLGSGKFSKAEIFTKKNVILRSF
eukprot:gene4544-20796_t